MSDIQQASKITDKSNELAPGQFYFSPLEAILINKKMPFGIKLESEENVLRAIDMSKQVVRKNKITSDKNKYRRNDTSELLSNENSIDQTKMVRDRKPVPRDDLGYALRDPMKNKMASSAKSSVYKKCEKVFSTIKKNPLSENFYQSSSPDMPSLLAIEKKLRNNKYENFNDFASDLRKLWSYYFSNFSTNPDIYQKTLNISNFTETIINDSQANKPEPNDIKEINKKINTIQKDLKDIKGNQIPTQERRPGTEKIGGDQPMSQAEKTQLSINIKKLPVEQLMGIIQIMKDTINLNNNKSHMEFDINSLSAKKLRELEKYVASCMKGNSNKNENYQKLKTDLTQKAGALNNLANNQAQGIYQLRGNTQPIQSNMMAKPGSSNPNTQSQGEKKEMPEQTIPKKPANTDKAILSESDSSSESSNSSLSSFN